MNKRRSLYLIFVIAFSLAVSAAIVHACPEYEHGAGNPSVCVNYLNGCMANHGMTAYALTLLPSVSYLLVSMEGLVQNPAAKIFKPPEYTGALFV